MTERSAAKRPGVFARARQSPRLTPANRGEEDGSRSGRPATVRRQQETLQPPDPVGISGIPNLLLTPDGRAYTYNVVRKLSELYLVEGLR